MSGLQWAIIRLCQLDTKVKPRYNYVLSCKQQFTVEQLVGKGRDWKGN
jgi:hypothetical protein